MKNIPILALAIIAEIGLVAVAIIKPLTEPELAGIVTAMTAIGGFAGHNLGSATAAALANNPMLTDIVTTIHNTLDHAPAAAPGESLIGGDGVTSAVKPATPPAAAPVPVPDPPAAAAPAVPVFVVTPDDKPWIVPPASAPPVPPAPDAAAPNS